MLDYITLNKIGIDVWQSKGEMSSIYAAPFIYNPCCLVILSVLGIKEAPEVTKLLIGMLNVLELDLNTQVSVIRFNPKEIIKENTLLEEVGQWQPQSILQFGDDVLELDSLIPFVIQTLHPAHLLENPKDKSIAYQALLKLKKYIHDSH